MTTVTGQLERMDEHDANIISWAIKGVGTVVLTLAGSVAFLFRNWCKDVEQLKAEAKECREDREDLRCKVAGLEVRLDQICPQEES